MALCQRSMAEATSGEVEGTLTNGQLSAKCEHLTLQVHAQRSNCRAEFYLLRVANAWPRAMLPWNFLPQQSQITRPARG